MIAALPPLSQGSVRLMKNCMVASLDALILGTKAEIATAFQMEGAPLNDLDRTTMIFEVQEASKQLAAAEALAAAAMWESPLGYSGCELDLIRKLSRQRWQHTRKQALRRWCTRWRAETFRRIRIS